MARRIDPGLHDAKRTAILDAAERLVATKGYEAMSLQDLLDALGMSKGAFYHYFESKPDVLLALVERRTAAVEANLLALVEDRTLAGADKLARHFAAVDDWKQHEGRLVVDVARSWYGDENALVRHKLLVHGLGRITPLLARIIQQGVDEGAFTTRDPEQTARMILCLRHDLGRAVAEAVVAEPHGEPDVARMAAATADAIERLLGAAPGSLWPAARAIRPRRSAAT
ncbi:TetR/AcrR family transcriptional regulator [Nannocystis sp. SCPEA4]|uniref:TetR/AcrR family transcriptional regulator n=1 Tax=Nannocystis sp. SCPEA4 TaxID=2996787 RepID=UPI00226F1E8C|nr:TetR/AcrR family transcriptional regulator [Nannocystis sp. SCPEA4]MCY1055037.1 TetR/AcrR family transcriptional regulator [Nannocystis sp. SCPEA4]